MSDAALEYFATIRGNNTYLLADSTGDRKRLTLQLGLTVPVFKQALKLAFDRFDLWAKLRDPQYTFRVIDLGCGEGLYVPILQDFLKEHEIKAQIRMVGIDHDPAAIATAKEYIAALGFRNARFYVHDLTQPLTQIEGLDLAQPENHFDLAYALVTLMHLKDVPRTLSYILEALKPGGAFYTKDVSLSSSLNYPSPALTKLGSLMGQLMLKMVGDDFALHQQEYLKATGFEQIEAFETHYVIGGRTQTGRRALEDILLSQHAFRSSALKLGIMSASDYDKLMQQEFQEITPDLEGKVTSNNSIARRPMS